MSTADRFPFSIPNDWREMKLKYIAELKSGETITSDSISETGDYPVMGGNGLRGYTSSFTHSGDFILVGRQGALCGNVNYAMGEFWASEHAIVTHVRGNNEVYWLGELLRSMNLNQYSQSAAQPGISVEVISNLKIPVPPIAKQQLISNYLKCETTHIDALIAEKERMLALLEEKRAALISQAVTRGLDPDVPLKPSGLDWLGDIPGHWEVIPIKYLANVGNGSTPSVDNENYWDETGCPWLNSSVVNTEYADQPSRRVSATALRECHLPKIDPPAVLVGITGQGKTRGLATVLTYEATINQHLAFIKTQEKQLDAEYLRFVLGRAYLFLRNQSDGAGSTKGAITCEQIANFRIPIPPIEEQVGIINKIVNQKSESNQLRHELSTSVKLLKERRSALITAAVTGQIDPEEMAA